MKLILIPLFFLLILAITIQMINLTPISPFGEGQTEIPVNEQLNDLGISNQTFNIITLTGFIAFFITITAIGIFAGLNISVFGSTVQISDNAQKIVYNAAFYGGLWGIFSTLAIVGINGLSIFSIFPPFGAIFYLILTLLYVLGINKQISGTS